jgi:hypothetical protein
MVEEIERRRSEKRQRTEQFRVRLTPPEKTKLEERAEAAGMDVAAFVRHQTLGERGPRTRVRFAGDVAELARLRGELGRVGNNLNQLTRLANIGDIERPAMLDAALADVLALLIEVRSAMTGRP